MNKKRIIFVILIFASIFLYSKEKKQLIAYLDQNCMGWNDYKDEMNFYDAINLYDNTYLVIGIRPKIEVMHFFLTDGENFAKSVRLSTEIDNIKSKNKIDNLSLFIKDFDYDMKNDFITMCYGESNFTYIQVNSVYKDNKPLLDILFLNYNSDYNFTWIDYCIFNGKRGIVLKTKGERLSKKEYYNFVGDVENYYVFSGNGKENLSFFFWSAEEQRYILEENVSQEQLKNIYYPDNYFAYNGLKFSKLDSKLTEADLKDLDKSQLRIMRNAVYARHGRTFKSVDLQSLWECYTWYKKNPNYNDSMLTDIDKYNIELIQKYEAK